MGSFPDSEHQFGKHRLGARRSRLPIAQDLWLPRCELCARDLGRCL